MIDAFVRLEKESFSRHVAYLTETDLHTEECLAAYTRATEEQEMGK